MLNGISNQMGAQFDRLRCEVCQNLILSPMNTGLLRYAVATALTVYGIETRLVRTMLHNLVSLQQHLPFTVLKLRIKYHYNHHLSKLQQHLPFTVLKHYTVFTAEPPMIMVATALTVYGIET